MQNMLTSLSDQANNWQDEENKEASVSAPTRLGVDAFEKVRLLDSERLERTIWVSPLPSHIQEARVKKFFEDKKCGLVLEVRIRESPKV